MHILKGVVWEDGTFHLLFTFGAFYYCNGRVTSKRILSFQIMIIRKMNYFFKALPFLYLVFFNLIQAKVDRPNILFVFTDDHAPHAIGAYNGWLKSVNPTPVIDKLARDGMLFVNSFCTNSICGPSRAVIQT